MVYEVLKKITVHNWFCGEITALHAWSYNCTIESKSEQNKIRRELSKIGYKCSFGGGILHKIYK